MDRPAKEIVLRLGAVGLNRVLDDLLDSDQLVRLANACGLKYPGMRTQSQSRQRLLSDLVSKAEATEAARLAIFRLLDKQVGAASQEWAALPVEEKTRRLCDQDFLVGPGNLGLHLFLLARADDDSGLNTEASLLARTHLQRIASNGHPSPAAPARDDSRLRKKFAGLEKKVRYLEEQLSKSREVHKTFKRDLIERKGELAESRMLVERLRGELAELAARLASAQSPPAAPGEGAAGELAQAVRKLAAEQKKLGRNLLKLGEALPARPAPDAEPLAPVLQSIQELRNEFSRQRRERRASVDEQIKRLDELRSEVRSRREAAGGPARRPRAKGEQERVGVFVDVQNMYYGARQLKGKLDFDALLQAAVRERRLIQATAYVVESREIDQSQFIARLQQRAIDVRRKPLQVRADGSMKGDWDMELALDILDAAPRLDVVVLVSGDGDFTSLVKRVKSMGPRVEVMAFPKNTAKSLLEAADHFHPLDRDSMIDSKKTKAAAGKRPGARAPETEMEVPPAPQPAEEQSAAEETVQHGRARAKA